MKILQLRVNQRTKVVILAAVILAILLAVYACGILIPAEAVEGDFLNANLAPSFSHLFGTDALGRDLFLRTLKGLALSITIGILASVISAVIAVLVGIAAASGSKRLDAVINWCIDLVMSVPHTILIILISFALGRGFRRNALVQPGASDSRRSFAASHAAICRSIAQARKINGMDSEKSPFAAFAAAVYRRSCSAVSACDFARSVNLILRLRTLAGTARHRHYFIRKHALPFGGNVVERGTSGLNARFAGFARR